MNCHLLDPSFRSDLANNLGLATEPLFGFVERFINPAAKVRPQSYHSGAEEETRNGTLGTFRALSPAGGAVLVAKRGSGAGRAGRRHACAAAL